LCHHHQLIFHFISSKEIFKIRRRWPTYYDCFLWLLCICNNFTYRSIRIFRIWKVRLSSLKLVNPNFMNRFILAAHPWTDSTQSCIISKSKGYLDGCQLSPKKQRLKANDRHYWWDIIKKHWESKNYFWKRKPCIY